MRSRAGLVTGVLVAVAAGAVAVALGVTLLLTHIVDLRTSANASLRTGAYLDATTNLERLVVDAETGLRGYVITGDRAFLAPERSAVAEMPAAAAVLRLARWRSDRLREPIEFPPLKCAWRPPKVFRNSPLPRRHFAGLD